jgi:methylenetetrahydrofolate reductase (NADPH)
MPLHVGQMLRVAQPTLSFEFFPPKTPEGHDGLWRVIRELEVLQPDFISVTYGAGGSTRDRTLALVERVLAETDLLPVMHLTCVGTVRAELVDFARVVLDAGITNVLALRGDPPSGVGGTWTQTEGGLRYASELVDLLRSLGPFCVGVAAFPEGHPESPDLDSDVARLAHKCAAGADFAITQFFFQVDQYRRMIAALRSTGCTTPVVPGILPVTNPEQTRRFAKLAGATIPEALDERFRQVEHDRTAVHDLGVEVATQLGRDLLKIGAPGLHFYTLNRATATREVVEALRADGIWRSPSPTAL